MHLKAAGYPVGGFLKLARAIERRDLSLGGEIHYDSRVAKILVEGDQAVGVRLEDGTEHRSDVIISAADGRTTIFDMLEGRYVNDEIRDYYESLPLYPPILLISLGVDRTFEKRPPSVVGTVFPLDEPLTIAGREYEWLVPHRSDFDPTLAPEGKTLLKVTLASPYTYWKDLREHDRRGYKDEQEEIEDQIITLLDQRHPGLASQVEMVDVATPISFERYTGCWQGSWLGWAATPEAMGLHISKTLPGLGSFYMVGTWVMNSSLPRAATSGRHITQIICHQDGKPFVTTIP
jgi:phytoene dehydrogenase-like protein